MFLNTFLKAFNYVFGLWPVLIDDIRSALPKVHDVELCKYFSNRYHQISRKPIHLYSWNTTSSPALPVC